MSEHQGASEGQKIDRAAEVIAARERLEVDAMEAIHLIRAALRFRAALRSDFPGSEIEGRDEWTICDECGGIDGKHRHDCIEPRMRRVVRPASTEGERDSG